MADDVASYFRLSEEDLEEGFSACRVSSLILAYCPSVKFAHGRDGRFIFVNKAWEECFERSREDVLGKTLDEVFGSEFGQKFHRENEEVFRTGKKAEFHQTWETHGTTRYYLVVKYPIRDEDGTVRAVAGVAYDVTSVKELEIKAVQASKTKSRFLSNMSHEMRTPLNGIVGMISLARSMAKDEKQANFLRLAAVSAKKLVDMVNDVLDLAQIEAGNASIGYKTFSLHGLVSETMNACSYMAQDRRIRMDFHISENTPDAVIGDDKKVRQVLSNIVGNAIKFTREGEIVVSVAPVHAVCEEAVYQFVPVQTKKCTIEFTVRDTGIGIPPDKLQTIFDRFEQIQSDLTITQGGAGLGLAISKKYVELMDGKIWADSTLGKGSTFFVVIPFDLPPA